MIVKHPNIFQIDNLQRHIKTCSTRLEGDSGKYVPARPLGFPSLRQRFKATWLVFTGKADALKWRGQ